jgi:hypothetical protein
VPTRPPVGPTRLPPAPSWTRRACSLGIRKQPGRRRAAQRPRRQNAPAGNLAAWYISVRFAPVVLYVLGRFTPIGNCAMVALRVCNN